MLNYVTCMMAFNSLKLGMLKAGRKNEVFKCRVAI